MRYFESRTPLVKVFASGGEVVKWVTVDGSIGWFATDRPGTLKTLDHCIAKKVGGLIREGTQEEYEAFSKKVQGAPRFQREREFITPEGVMNTFNNRPASNTSAPLKGGDDVAVGDPAPPPVPVPVVKAPDPVLRKRGRPRKVEVVVA